jgi:hypothetical protein
MKYQEASFFRLFRRSHYCQRVEDDDDSDEAKRERRERERFAAAAIGFCLKHSPEFQDRFWHKVCRTEMDGQIAPLLNVEVEPVHWADLRLTAETKEGRFAWVVECKAGAPLEQKQNPGFPEFATPGIGYGKLFEQEEKRHKNSSQLRYIVLGATEDFNDSNDCHGLNIAVQKKQWSDVASIDASNTLVADLFDSLGEIGISFFRMKEIQPIHVTSGFGPAAEAWEVVNALFDICGFRRSDFRISADRPAPKHFNIGAYLRRPPSQKEISRRHKELLNVLNPPGDDLAWMGYESGPTIPNGFRRSVWLYCRDEESANYIAKKMSGAISDAVTSVQREYEREGDWCAIIGAGADSTTRDLDWFQKVLETVGK